MPWGMSNLDLLTRKNWRKSCFPHRFLPLYIENDMGSSIRRVTEIWPQASALSDRVIRWMRCPQIGRSRCPAGNRSPRRKMAPLACNEYCYFDYTGFASDSLWKSKKSYDKIYKDTRGKRSDRNPSNGFDTRYPCDIRKDETKLQRRSPCIVRKISPADWG